MLIVILMLCIAGLLIWWGPVWTIWSLNLVFHTDIPVTFYTWLSVLWLSGLIGSTIESFQRKR